MKVLVVGGGGREHALCWSLARSPEVELVSCAPGNPGTARLGPRVPVAADDLEGLVEFARREAIDLTVVGPEQPLVAGLVDRFTEAGLLAFGPSAAAAELEGSKAAAKAFLERWGIPTARAAVVRDAAAARQAVARFGLPVVLKADGLAAGKGVLLPADEEELEAALALFFDQRRFGASGEVVLVEEYLTGEEVSAIAVCDGHRLEMLASSKDYKRIGDGDCGANTGGMGAHSPSGLVDEALAALIRDTILQPTLDGMAQEGRSFRGFLYAGLMLTSAGPRVLEYNVRLGDPEAQALLLRLESDLAAALAAAARGQLPAGALQFAPGASVCLVLADRDYPEAPQGGERIQGLDRPQPEGVEVFHAGTAEVDGHIVAQGGRVLDVCARGADLASALDAAYAAAAGIDWPRRRLRRDIGRRRLGEPFAGL